MIKYDSYKDSGVEWIGEIPDHWGNVKIKSLFSFNKGQGLSKGLLSEEGKYKCILYGELFTSYKNQNVIFNVLSKTNNLGNIISKGDEILIPGSTTTTGIDLSNSKHLPHKGISLGGDIIILKPRINTTSPEYYSYFITYVSTPEFIVGSRGVTIYHIYPKQIREIHVCYPPIREQQQIVSFLDTKTILIDTLIEKTQNKIELLKEKRISLINHVVTKGLNPNVEMKDSEERWLGFYPSSWMCVNFGVISSLQQGLQIPFDNRFFEQIEDSYEYITTQSIHRPKQPRQYIKSPKKSVLCYEDDIVYGRTGNTGEVVTGVHGVFHNNFFRIDFNRKKINKEYLIWFLNNSRFKEHILLISGTTTIPDLNHSDFFSTRFLIPPIEEQQQIVEYLDEQTKLIDSTVTKEQKRIELLKEYRQSLISNVVTGKIKVTTDE